MVIKSNKRGRTVAGMILGLCALFVCGQLAFAQPAVRGASPREAASPAPAQAMSAYRTLEGWVRAWHVPEKLEPVSDQGERSPGTAPTAACVILRFNGELIGRGVAITPANTGDARGAGMEALRAAAQAAIAQATPRLRVPNDAGREDALRALAADVVISLELAGPFVLSDPQSWGDVDRDWNPGLDGVAVRTSAAASTPEVVFPSVMLAANMIPSRALSSAVAQVIGEGGAAAALDEPKKLSAERGLKMYRFRVTHLAQPRPGAAPEFLHRGVRLIPAGQAITVGELRAMADRLAGHLADAVDRWPKEATTPREFDENSLARFATSEYTKMAGADAATLTKANQAVQKLDARAFTWRAEREPTAEDVVLAVAATVSENADDATRRLVLQNFTGDRERAEFKVQIPVEKRALFAFGYQAAHDQSTNACRVGIGTDLESIAACIRSVFRDTPEGGLVAQMPWLGWAEVRRWDSEKVIAQGPQDTAAIALRQMRDQCWQHQFSIADAGGIAGDNADMIGGILFTATVAEGKSAPYPTWQSVRPLAFIATMLGDPRLTEPHERPREIVRLMTSLRFLRQLQVDDSSAWMYTNPTLARGGIRASVWDSSQPIEATAYTLLCIVETLKSLDALANPAPPTASPAIPEPAVVPSPR